MLTLLNRIATPIYALLDRLAPNLLPLLARFAFAAVLFRYFWVSAMTKFDGFGISDNAYFQILPKAMENANYDSSQLSFFHHLIVAFGSVSEIILPILFVIGFLARSAALGMIGFVIVQSLTDLWGHGLDAATFGAWFDKNSASLVMDQRTMWVVVMSIPLFMGGGWLSVDRLFHKNRA